MLQARWPIKGLRRHLRHGLGLSPDAFINGNYAFLDADIMPPQFCAIMPELCRPNSIFEEDPLPARIVH